ncbi:hypothetical protein RRG08_034273 [Elysia crispata]|uniref:Uncharacterized protein n=1 Tax=Elysia crispata TaxID=231223 RepID=A0AAE1A0J6_9GAST|nr:hypothetical protein RRG08_034273 [Elysia crispata]
MLLCFLSKVGGASPKLPASLSVCFKTHRDIQRRKFAVHVRVVQLAHAQAVSVHGLIVARLRVTIEVLFRISTAIYDKSKKPQSPKWVLNVF